MPIPDENKIPNGPQYMLWGTPREASSIAAGDASMALVTGKGRNGLRNRYLYEVASKGGVDQFDVPVEWPYEAINEVLLQEEFFDLRKPAIRRFIHDLHIPPIDLKQIQDSSDTGYGAFISRYMDYGRARDLIQGDPLTYANFQNGLVATAMAQLGSWDDLRTANLTPLLSAEVFSDLDGAESSLLRELIPILAGITALGDKVLRHLTVAFYTDNSGVPCVLRRGSRNRKIHNIALAIDNALTQYDIVAIFHWVPREEGIMVAADKASRITDYHSYSFNPTGFAAFFSDDAYNWPSPEIDLFADRRNSNCPQFYSQTFSQGCLGVDALSSIWPTNGLLYAVPPIIHAPVVLHRALAEEQL